MFICTHLIPFHCGGLPFIWKFLSLAAFLERKIEGQNLRLLDKTKESLRDRTLLLLNFQTITPSDSMYTHLCYVHILNIPYKCLLYQVDSRFLHNLLSDVHQFKASPFCSSEVLSTHDGGEEIFAQQVVIAPFRPSALLSRSFANSN